MPRASARGWIPQAPWLDLSVTIQRRSRGYRDIRYDMVMTNDSLNGWPEGVEIPVSLREDRTFAEAIRRIGRHGADAETGVGLSA